MSACLSACTAKLTNFSYIPKNKARESPNFHPDIPLPVYFNPGTGSVAGFEQVAEVSLVQLLVDVVGVDGEGLCLQRRYVVHGVHHNGLHDRTKSAGAELEFQSLARIMPNDLRSWGIT